MTVTTLTPTPPAELAALVAASTASQQALAAYARAPLAAAAQRVAAADVVALRNELADVIVTLPPGPSQDALTNLARAIDVTGQVIAVEVKRLAALAPPPAIATPAP